MTVVNHVGGHASPEDTRTVPSAAWNSLLGRGRAGKRCLPRAARWWGAVLLGLVCVGPSSVSAAPDLSVFFGAVRAEAHDADSYIRLLLSRGRSAQFVGIQETVIYRPQRKESSQKVTQKDGRRRVLYLDPPSLKGKEIYSDGPLTLFFSGSTAHPDLCQDDGLDALPKRSLGKGRVAGRQAYVVEVRPHAQSGGTRRIWIDTRTGVPLRWEDRDATGDIVSKTAYTSIAYDSEIPSRAVISPPGFQRRSPSLPLRMPSIAEAEKVVRFEVKVPDHLPEGYQRQAVTVASIGTGKCRAQRVTLSFSNGLGIITLAQAPVRYIDDAPRPGKVQVSPYGQWVWVRGGNHFVLSATPPLTREEMQQIADSVR